MSKKPESNGREIYLGAWLKHFDMGPTEAARIAGCSQSYISNISAGRKKNINALILLKLSEHFEININDFFRPIPSQSQMAAFEELSPKARASLLNNRRRRA